MLLKSGLYSFHIIVLQCIIRFIWKNWLHQLDTCLWCYKISNSLNNKSVFRCFAAGGKLNSTPFDVFLVSPYHASLLFISPPVPIPPLCEFTNVIKTFITLEGEFSFTDMIEKIIMKTTQAEMSRDVRRERGKRFNMWKKIK